MADRYQVVAYHYPDEQFSVDCKTLIEADEWFDMCVDEAKSELPRKIKYSHVQMKDRAKELSVIGEWTVSPHVKKMYGKKG